MRKIHLFGATILALSTSAWSLTALAQPAPATAPAAPVAPAAPMAAPAPEATPAPATPAPDASTPASGSTDSAAPASNTAKPAKKHVMHHATHGRGKLVATKAGDKAVDDLNAASLDSAKSGKPFSAPPTPDAAKQAAHAGDANASTKHHHMTHKTAKKSATSGDSAAAPAPSSDATSTPPTDSSGK